VESSVAFCRHLPAEQREVSSEDLHLPGAFAEFVAVPTGNCHRVAQNVSFEEACTAEPLAVGVHAVRLTPVGLGDSVVIVGSGVIGLMLLQASGVAGAGKIYVTDLVDYRLRKAEELGADFVINAGREDPVQRIMGLTDMKGVDRVLEAVGTQTSVQQAMKMTKNGGVVTVLGVLESTMNLDVLSTVVREIQIKGSYAYVPTDIDLALDLIAAGKVDVKPLITHVFSLDDIRKGFEVLEGKKEEVIKVVIRPSLS